MQPEEITVAFSKQGASSPLPTSSAVSISILPSEPLPWRPNNRPKLPPGALLDIDQGPLWDILTEWLPLESVCHLDSALCQKWRRRRADWLTMLSTKVLLFNREDIKVLKISRRILFTHRALGAEALNWVLKRGIHLASLRLPFPYFFSENELESMRMAVESLVLNDNLDKLESFHLSRSAYIKDADLAALISKCYGSLNSIDLMNCGLTESAATHIKRCTKLEEFTPNGNESAADMVEIFQACRKLRKVNLSAFSDGIVDVALSVADNCPLMEHLDLQSCARVSDASFKKVAESCPMLQFVNLSNTKITDATVVGLCNRCHLLKRMFLGHCLNLTDVAVLAVAKMLPGLTHIDLSYNPAITSSAMEILASKCFELESIYLTNCLNVRDVTLMKIAEHCSKLRRLHLGGCPYVTAVGAAEIQSRCKLKYLGLDWEYYYDEEVGEEDDDGEENDGEEEEEIE